MNRQLETALKMIEVLRPVVQFFQRMATQFPTLTLLVIGAGVVLGGLAVILGGRLYREKGDSTAASTVHAVQAPSA